VYRWIAGVQIGRQETDRQTGELVCRNAGRCKYRHVAVQIGRLPYR
jgi:hypothetical protein